MGKRKRSSVQDNSSKEPSRSGTENEDGSDVDTAAKQKKTKKNKSSADLCEEWGLKHVDMIYTIADYQNLTTYSIFVQQTRPAILQANPDVSSSKMNAILAAKWKEFETAKAENETLTEPSSGKISEDENEEKDDDEVTSVSSKGSAQKKKITPLKIKLMLPTPLRASGRDKKGKKAVDSEDDFVNMDEDSDSGRSGRRRSGRAAAKQKKKEKKTVESDEQEESAVEDDNRRRSSRKPRAAKTKKKKMTESDEEFEKMLEDSDEDDRKKQRRRETKSSKKKKQSSDDDDFEDADSDSDSDSGPGRTRGGKRKTQGDSSSDQSGPGRRHSGRVKKKKKPRKVRIDDEFTEETTSDSDTDFEFRIHKKKSHSKRRIKSKKKRGSDESGSQQSEMDDDDIAKMAAKIPERKSGRKHQKLNKNANMTDKEFEKMLKENDREEAKAIEEKARRARRRRDSSTSDSDESEHEYWCAVCKDGGDLLLCDTCPKVYHKKCLKMKSLPEGDWSCPLCKGDKLPDQSWCRVCKDGGELIICDECNWPYHLDCLEPPLDKIPEGEWKCPRCLAPPLRERVRRILTWRWKDPHHETDELDQTPHSPKKKRKEKSKLREYFVKYLDLSYWECNWVDEVCLDVEQPLMLKMYKGKHDMAEPPPLEDGSSYGIVRHQPHSHKAHDSLNLEETYYRYGIKPEWLAIHRFVKHRRHGKEKQYLVKWRDLTYQDSTWESTSSLAGKHCADFKKHIELYQNRRDEKLGKKKSKEEKKRPKRSLLKKKLEKQPEYLDETGGSLHNYQLEGLNWLRFSWSQGTDTILADEMGLGKTIQAISFLRSLWKEGYADGPFLVAAPLSTIINWEREFEFWAPDMYVLSFIGDRDSRCVIRDHEFSYEEHAVRSGHRPSKFRDGCQVKFDVLLTNYEMINVESTLLSSIHWDVLVIDEAHRLKNNQSLFFRTLQSYQIDYKLLLTGTPLQNNLEELFNLLNFMCDQEFSDLDGFLDEFSDISKDEQVARLHAMLGPRMLRRLKADVLGDVVPQKSEFIVRVELSPMQKKYYKYILTKNYDALHSNKGVMQNIMMQLRKCCNHPYLFAGAREEAPISKTGFYEGNALIKACGKMQLLSTMLKKLRRDNHRVLIFSQMTKVLDVLEDFLEHEGLKYERIDGGITGQLRQEAIDRFNAPNAEQFVFLLSTRAGGLGINLASADTVVIYDMDWNPHNDIQAFSRAHRIGQQNKVMIYRFVTRGTVEERIAHVAKKKMMLTHLVVRPGIGSSSQELSRKELNDILKFGAEDLFKEDEDSEKLKVVYDDKAVEKLLDRSQQGMENKESLMNDYLSSFKVATYDVKEDEEAEEEEEPAKEEVAPEPEKEDPEFWQKVLGAAYVEHQVEELRQQEQIAMTLGKGKRVRKQVNYKDTGKLFGDKEEEEEEEEEEDNVSVTKYMSDYDPSSTDHSEDSGEESGDAEQAPNVLDKVKKVSYQVTKAMKEKKSQSVEMPPLLARVNSHVEVLGFNARQRKTFLEAVMKFGMPGEDAYRTTWCPRDLRKKPERHFKAYVSLFMRHLCEPGNDDSEEFSDGVPREGMSRAHVLTRIGILALVRKKVLEYEKINAISSVPFQSATSLINSYDNAHIRRTPEKKKEKNKAESKEEKSDKSEEKKSDQENSSVKEKVAASGDHVTEKKNEEEKMEVSTEEVKEVKSEEKMEVTEEGVKEEKSDVKMEVDSENKEKEKTAENKDGDTKSEENQEKSTNEEKKDEDAETKEASKSENTAVKEESSKGDTPKEDNKTENTAGKEEASKGDAPKEDNKTENTAGKEEASKGDTPKDANKTEKTADESKMDILKEELMKFGKSTKQMSSAEWLQEMKHQTRLLYIADGGFTELQALWHYEEGSIKPGSETVTWHRRHDFWLLAGIVTHGYARWSEILDDPRFGILEVPFEKAFGSRAVQASASAVAFRGRFLHRRFMLLEQALIVEEHLRKAANMLETKSSSCSMKDIEKIAAQMRELSRMLSTGATVPPADKPIYKVFLQLQELLGDMRQIPKSFPPTLSRAPNQQQPVNPVYQRPDIKSVHQTTVSRKDPAVAAYEAQKTVKGLLSARAQATMISPGGSLLGRPPKQHVTSPGAVSVSLLPKTPSMAAVSRPQPTVTAAKPAAVTEVINLDDDEPVESNKTDDKEKTDSGDTRVHRKDGTGVPAQAESEKTDTGSNITQTDSEKPQPESEKPQTESEKPQPESGKPQTESEKPQPESEKPQTESEKPQPEFEKPQIESEKPQPESEKPQTESEKPDSENTQTANQSTDSSKAEEKKPADTESHDKDSDTVAMETTESSVTVPNEEKEVITIADSQEVKDNESSETAAERPETAAESSETAAEAKDDDEVKQDENEAEEVSTEEKMDVV